MSRRGDPTHQIFVPLLAPSVRRWAPNASALIFAMHQLAAGPEQDAPLYSDYAAYDLGQAVAHLCIQAGALGLSCHQFAAFDHSRVVAEARVPSHWSVTTGIAIGVGVESDGALRTRRPLNEVAYHARFGEAVPLLDHAGGGLSAH